MESIKTERLQIVPLTLEMAEGILDKEIRVNFPLKIDKDYPSEEIKDVLPFYLEELKTDPSILGWGIWLMVLSDQQLVIGDLGFKGKPTEDGIVEIGYGISPNFRQRGFTFESVSYLIEWAFKQSEVTKVIAECEEDNLPSIRILQKIGMKQVNQKGTLLYWELAR